MTLRFVELVNPFYKASIKKSLLKHCDYQGAEKEKRRLKTSNIPEKVSYSIDRPLIIVVHFIISKVDLSELVGGALQIYGLSKILNLPEL